MQASCVIDGLKTRLYGHQEVALSIGRYQNGGRICLKLLRVENGVPGEPCAVCTVNLPHVPMAQNEVAIKTWYQNVGMLGWLIDEKIVSHPVRYAFYANTFIPICCLLISQEDAAA
jgi:hypothetical protein